MAHWKDIAERDELDPIRVAARQAPLEVLEEEIGLLKHRIGDRNRRGLRHDRLLMAELVGRVVVREQRRREYRRKAEEAKRRGQAAIVETDTAENERGFWQDATFATCKESGLEVGPIWGTGERSAQRALFTLDAECDCGSGRHKEE